MTYRAKEPLLAVRDCSPSEDGFVTIPRRAILATTGEARPSGFVGVRYEGRMVIVFLQDLETRADVVDDKWCREAQ